MVGRSYVKVLQTIMKIRPRYELISKILSRDWRAWKNWFLVLTTFLARVIFWSIIFEKRSKKGRNKKIFGIQKSVLSGPSVMQRNFLKYVLYFQTFLQELQMAASIPILRIDV